MWGLRFVVVFVIADTPVVDDGAARPQPVVARALSIEDALALAAERSENVAIGRAGVRRARADQTRAWSDWYPQINASLSYERTLLSEFDVLFDAAAVAAPSPDGAGATGSLADLPFGRKNTWRPGVQVTQNLFAGGRSFARVQAASAGNQIAQLGLRAARAQALLDAVQTYYDTVLADRLVRIAEASLRQAALTLELTRVGNEQGTIPDFDLLRARVTYEIQQPAVRQRRDELEIAQASLKLFLDLPLDATFALTTPLEGDVVDVSPAVRAAFDEQRVGEDVAVRAPVEQAQQVVALREAAEAVAWSQYLPQLDVSMSYGPVAYPGDLFPAPGDFRYNWIVGVALTLPLFTGFRVDADIASARADRDEAAARLRQTEELAVVDAQRTRRALGTSAATYAASSGAVAEARRAVEIAQLRYGEGISTLLELRDAQLQLDQAEINRAVAARDLQVARARDVLLSALPLTGSTGSGALTSSINASVTTAPTAPAMGSSVNVTGASGVGATGSVPATVRGATGTPGAVAGQR